MKRLRLKKGGLLAALDLFAANDLGSIDKRGRGARATRTLTYLTTPSSGELAVAYNFFGMRPER